MAINYSRSSYIDEAYYQKEMEVPAESDHKVYPVKVMALSMDWVLDNESGDGERFLL